MGLEDGLTILVLVGVLLFIAIRTRIGWMIIGLLAVVCGVIYGFMSHRVSYQVVSKGDVEPLFVSGGTDYFHVLGTATYYVVDEKSFTPNFSGLAFSRDCTGGMDITTETDSQSLDVTLTSDGKDTEYRGTSYKVVAIACFDQTGQPTQQFLTSEYLHHPTGFIDDHWPIARIIIYCGIGAGALAALALALPAAWKRIFK